MTNEKYNNIIEKINNCLNFYEKMKENNKYILYLANGDVLNVKILRNNIPHLLGVDIDYLRQTNKFKSDMNSYECLKYFLEESYSFYKLINEGKITVDKLFSKFINEKISAFETNISIRIDDLMCIVKYDPEKTYKVEESHDISDYYIVRKNMNKYYLLGLKKNDNEKLYLATTSREYEDYYEFEKFIKRLAYKQELTYSYFMGTENIYNGYRNNFNIRLDDKINMLDNLIKYAKKYSATAGVASDFSFSINKSKSNIENNSSNLGILRLLSDNLKQGNVLDNDTLTEITGMSYIPEEIKYLIDICNDLVCSSINNEKGTEQYSILSKENINLKEELQQIKNILKNQGKTIEELETENQRLKESNVICEQKLNIFEEAYQKVKGI